MVLGPWCALWAATGAAQAAPPQPAGDTVPSTVVARAAPSGADTLPMFRPDQLQATDTTAQPVVVELRIGRLAGQTVPAYRVRTEALIPLTQFFQMAEILFRLTPEGRLEAVRDPGRVPLVVDARSDTLVYGRRRLPIAPEFKRFVDGELYVGAERLSDLLGLRISVDWVDLVVTVVDASTLPVGRRVQREAAREAFVRRRSGPDAEAVLGLERTRWGGLVLDYSLFLPSVSPLASGGYSATIGADVFGGSLEAAVASENGIESGRRRLEGSWTGVWRDNPRVTQLALGDVFATGPRARGLQGVSVTNSPYVRPTLVGSYRYGGRLEPGWVVEAYRQGTLIAFDSADAAGAYGFDLPAYYGENPVSLVAYGPFGEIRTFNQTYRVLAQLLPARRFEYGAALGACRSLLCDATGNLDLRYGLSRRWTARAGLEQLWRDSLPDLTQPYVALTGIPLHPLAVEFEALAQGFARAAVNLEPSLDLRVTGDFAVFDPDLRGPALSPSSRRSEWGLTGFVRPLPPLSSFYFDASVRHTTSTAGGFTYGRVGASYQMSGVRFLPYARWERTAPAANAAATRRFGGFDVVLLPRLSWRSFWGRLWARGDAEVEDGAGLRTAAAVVGRNIAPAVTLEVGARYQRELGGTSLVATLQTYLPGARTVTVVDAPRGRTATGSVLLQGSALYNETGRDVGFTPGPSVERAGLTGRVFVDDDADGEWDATEEPAAGVRLRVGNHSAVTDSAGIFRVWGLLPFEPVLLAVDSLSIATPLVVPAFATASVTPSPNRFRTVAVPLQHSGVVEGRVLLVTAAGARGLGGASVILTNRTTGARQAVVTFSDGEFYVLGVKPGDYEVTVDQRVLDALGASVTSPTFQIAPDGSLIGPASIEIRITQDP